VTILREIARGTVEWEESETGMVVPSEVPEMDVSSFSVSENLQDHESRLKKLRDERSRYLTGFDDLDDGIADAVY